MQRIIAEWLLRPTGYQLHMSDDEQNKRVYPNGLLWIEIEKSEIASILSQCIEDWITIEAEAVDQKN